MNEKRKRGQYGKRPGAYDLLVERLYGKVAVTGISIGRALNVCENTGRARLNKPETITIGELKRLCKVYDITQEELFAIIKIGI